MTFRKKLYRILQPDVKNSTGEKAIEWFLVILIILNITGILMASVKELHTEYQHIFYQFEIFSVVVFTIEYLARIYSCVENPKYQHPFYGRLAYIKSPMAIIDLFAFLPFYLTFLPVDLRFLRIFRLFGLLRMFKVVRYLDALKIFQRVLAERKEQLVLSFVFILFVLICTSTVMFYAENEAQPTKFTSIPATLWWGIETITTVGYGDMIPITPLGRILGGVFALSGVGILALPAGILSSGFFELLHKPKPNQHTCPHCGKDFHD
jgi:voltage-gated potassium channel